MKRIAILGAGASGLTSIKACLEEGLTPVCFEKTDGIGGLWKYREKDEYPNLACVFKSTIINSCKESMSFSDFPVPSHWPNFMRNHLVLEYFHMYADKLCLKDHIMFNTSVIMINKADDFDQTGRWVIDLKDERTQEMKSETFDGVMICSGHHAIPNIPTFEGQDAFCPQIIHTHDYRVPDSYAGKRVLVVGIGNSAVDAAVDLSRVAKQVFLSTRRGAWVIKRTAEKGLPGDLVYGTRFGTLFPLSMVNNMAEAGANKVFDHDMYGLRPAHRFTSAHPTVNDDLPNKIINGDIKVKGDIKRFMSTGVIFNDGSMEELDAVILGTGYNIRFPFLPKAIIDVQSNQVELFKYVFIPDLSEQTLAFVGLAQPLGSTIALAELQSRWIARVLSGASKLPDNNEMWKDIRTKKEVMAKRYVSSVRHTIQIDMIQYCDEIASQFGVKPDLWEIFKTDKKFFMTLMFGPHLPYCYRLEGPGKWDGAKEAIETVWDRIRLPLQSRQSVKKDNSFSSAQVLIFVAVVAFILYMFVL